MNEPAAGPAGIFISYRRADAGYPAGWLHDRLAAHYGPGRVFKDVDSIRPGDDFAAKISAALGSCAVLLAVIGPQWLTAAGEQGRRLDDPGDFVRREIEAALSREVLVIPVLVAGARPLEANDLPGSLQKLADRQAVRLNPDQFGSDAGRLLSVLDAALTAAAGLDEASKNGIPAAALASIPDKPETNVESESSRSVHTGAKIRAWGANDSGQRDVPEWLAGVSAIAASSGYSMAITSRGKIASWGKTDHRTGPRGLSDVKAIAAGRWHSLALTHGGEVVPWVHAKADWILYWNRNNPKILPARPYPFRSGENRFQEWRAERSYKKENAEYERKLAETSTQHEAARLHALNQFEAVPAGISGVVDIAAGAGFSLALCKNEASTVWCWGPDCPEMDLDPEEVADLVAIDAGSSHCVGLKADGTVVAWGKPRSACEIPLGLTEVIAVAAGESHSLALRRDGTVAAWGANKSKQRDVPIGLADVVAIAAGKSHSLALRRDGSVVSWGGSKDDRPPKGLAGVHAIAASSHSLAIHD
jgi:hypothetical protein